MWKEVLIEVFSWDSKLHVCVISLGAKFLYAQGPICRLLKGKRLSLRSEWGVTIVRKMKKKVLDVKGNRKNLYQKISEMVKYLSWNKFYDVKMNSELPKEISESSNCVCEKEGYLYH